MSTTITRVPAADELPDPRPAEPPQPPAPPGPPEFRRVITGLRHGGHAVSEQDEPSAQPDARALALVTNAPEPLHLARITSPFGYLFGGLRDDYPFAHLDVEPPAAVVTALKALGSAMVESSFGPDGDCVIPPIYTYFGQFIDHDLTANTDRDDDIGITDGILEPLSPRTVLRDLRNLREPQLNLDSLYGRGPVGTDPEDVPFDGDAFVVTTTGLPPGPGTDVEPQTDLPRVTAAGPARGTAIIGDARNDENLIVAQIHGSLLRFHNAVLDWLDDGHDVVLAADDVPPAGYSERFWKARRLVQWHYQWVAVHDFLRTIAQPAVVDGLLDGTTEPLFTPSDEASTYMPLEFSIAAFRFGHSMVRGAYDWNENFGAPGTGAPSASFDQLFQFTGNGGSFVNQLGALPANWPARFERLTGAEAGVAGSPSRFARKIDTKLAVPLSELRNAGNDPAMSERINRILKRLAVRNLLRGYRLALPTGQAVAATIGVPPLTRAQLLDGNAAPGTAPDAIHDALVDGGFLDRTPLWFYVLREAEVLENGDRLGPVGSRIVAETILGQLRADPRSFLRANWTPAAGVQLGDGTPVDSIIALLRFAGVHPPVV